PIYFLRRNTHLGKRVDRRNCVLDLLAFLDGRNNEIIEVLMRTTILLHELYEILDVGRANVDNGLIDHQQLFLQLAELFATNNLARALIGVDGFDRYKFSVWHPGSKHVWRATGLTQVARIIGHGYLHLLSRRLEKIVRLRRRYSSPNSSRFLACITSARESTAKSGNTSTGA